MIIAVALSFKFSLLDASQRLRRHGVPGSGTQSATAALSIVMEEVIIERTCRTCRGNHETLYVGIPFLSVLLLDEERTPISVDRHLTIFSGRVPRGLSAEQDHNIRDRPRGR